MVSDRERSDPGTVHHPAASRLVPYLQHVGQAVTPPPQDTPMDKVVLLAVMVILLGLVCLGAV